MQQAWVVVVPVKELRLAKTRLLPLGDQARERLALAIARDVVSAAIAVDAVHAVYVVTNDRAAAFVLAADGAYVIPDTPDTGLNAALTDGASIVAARHPQAAVAAVSSDLPGMTSAELAAALGAAGAAPRAFVADAAGTGTTALTCLPGNALGPAFGASSRDRHLASGARELDGDWPGLRCDVDTPADLARALARPVGAHTAAALAELQVVL